MVKLYGPRIWISKMSILKLSMSVMKKLLRMVKKSTFKSKILVSLISSLKYQSFWLHPNNSLSRLLNMHQMVIHSWFPLMMNILSSDLKLSRTLLSVLAPISSGVLLEIMPSENNSLSKSSRVQPIINTSALKLTSLLNNSSVAQSCKSFLLNFSF